MLRRACEGLAILVALSSSAVATQHVVSPAGDDGNSGLTVDDPKRTIKSTLASLADSDTLYLLEGTYDVVNQGGSANLSGFCAPGHHILLAGYPTHTATVDWSGATLSAPDRFLNITNGATSVRVENLTFTGWRNDNDFIYNSLGDSLSIVDCRFHGVSPLSPWSILHFRHVRGAAVIRCTITGRQPGSWGYAIVLEGDPEDGGSPENFVVRDCVFNSASDLADTLGWGPGLLATGVDGLDVRDCRGYNAGEDHGRTGTASHFMDLRDVDGAVISGLWFKRYLFGKTQSSWVHNANGVTIASWSGKWSEDVSISDCAFWGAGHGIHAGNGAAGVEISHVWCDSTYDDAVFFDDQFRDGTLSHLVSHHSQDNGVDVQGDDVTIRQCTIVRPANQAFNITRFSQGVTFLDNIVFDVRSPAVLPECLVSVDPGAMDWRFDHNLWFDPDGDQQGFWFEGSCQSFEAWRAGGCDANGLWRDPLLCDPGGRAWLPGIESLAIHPLSPAVGCGSDGCSLGALGVGCASSSVPEVLTGAGVVPGRHLPPNRPNPFTPSTTILYSIDEPGGIVLEVFDSGGRLVRRLFQGRVAPGTHSLVWDGSDDGERRLSAGVYVLTLSVEGHRVSSRKLTLLR